MLTSQEMFLFCIFPFSLCLEEAKTNTKLDPRQVHGHQSAQVYGGKKLFIFISLEKKLFFQPVCSVSLQMFPKARKWRTWANKSMCQQRKPQAAMVIYISLHSSDSADPPNYLLSLTHFYIFHGIFHGIWNNQHFYFTGVLPPQGGESAPVSVGSWRYAV